MVMICSGAGSVGGHPLEERSPDVRRRAHGATFPGS